MRRRAAALLVLSLAAGGCSSGRRGEPAPAAPVEQPRSEAPPSCDEAKTAAVAAWTRHRDRLAPPAIEAFAAAITGFVALVDAYLAYLDALLADAGRRSPAQERDLAALREEQTALHRLAAAPAAGATTADVLAAEQRYLAVVGAARRLSQRVVRRRAADDLKYASEGERARPLQASLKAAADAQIAGAARAAEAHTAWAVAELAARRGASDLAAVRTTVEIVSTTEALFDARDATRRAGAVCPEQPAAATPAAIPAGPGVRLAAELWRTRVEGNSYVPVEDGGILEVGAGADRRVVLGGPRAVEAFDPARGKSRWRRDFVARHEASEGRMRRKQRAAGGPLWPQLVGDGALVFAVDVDGELHALDVRTGAERWRVALAGGIASTPVLGDGVLYVASRYGELVALTVADGSRRFTRLLGGVDALALAGDRLVAADEDGFVVAVDVASAEYAWLTRLARQAFEAGPLVIGERVVVAERGGKVWALDLATGAQRWTQDLAVTPAGLVAHGDAVVFVGAGGTVAALEAATGAPKWRRDYPYDSTASARESAEVAVRNAPARSGDTLLLALGYPTALVQLDLRDGTPIDPPIGPDGSSLLTPVHVGDGRAYVFTAQHRLVAFTTAPRAAP